MKVRAATVSDAEMLSALATYAWMSAYAPEGLSRGMAAYISSEFSPARYRTRLMEKGRMIWVVEHKSRLIGLSEVLLRAPQQATSAATNIDKCYLHAAFRAKEIRTALFQHVITELKKYHIQSVWISVWHKDKETLRFYTDLGFQEVGEFFLDIDGEHHKHYILDNTANIESLE